jgi:GAF domain-containing protein
MRQVEIDSIGQHVTVVAGQIAERDQKLREMIDSLEERVAARTQRLEIAASLGGQLNAILDFDHLLDELVTQAKEQFGYYHVHVYLLDETDQNLVMSAGYGKVGERMKAQNHVIPLNTQASLVARAARTHQVMSVDNVRDDSTWLPNALCRPPKPS